MRSAISVFHESLQIVLSYVKWQLRPHPIEETFEQWVVNWFGGRLFTTSSAATLRRSGDCLARIRADWAAQRIKNLSLLKAVWNALTGANDTTSLIDSFYYPRYGPGMMWEAFRDHVVEWGGTVVMELASGAHRQGGSQDRRSLDASGQLRPRDQSYPYS